MDKFGRLSSRVERPQTFMEIAGYPHYENVCSNFLRFFFDPEGPHSLGSLFLDALLDSVGNAGGEEGLGGNVSVEREVGTAAGNRIDILIQSDSYAVLIENKICAAVANPFEDYAMYLDSLKNENGDAYEDEKKTKILLTLYPPREVIGWGFRNLTYADFASAVRSRLGYHVSKVDIRYLTLMLDFLNTLEHLGERTRMNQEYVKLLAERKSEVEEFLRGIKEVRDEMKGKARELGTLIDAESYQNVRQGDVAGSLRHALYQSVYKNDSQYVGIDTEISPSGWEIQIFPRQGVPRPEIEDLLNRLNIPFEDSWRCIYPTHFAYDEDLSRIAPVVQEIVGKLSASVG